MVDILLGTYNGQNFLPEQLDSIMRQTYIDWRIIIGDDGSSDQTIDVIQEYARKIPRKILFELDRTPAGGACWNFFSLLERSSADYLMFCDQDDIWLPDKIEVFLTEMRRMESTFGKDTPILIHSDLQVLRNGRIYDSFWKYQKLDPSRGDTLNRLLVQNTITGCATMFNAPLRRLCRAVPEQAIMHDWWVALVAAAFGKISRINTPTMIYRQHEGNVVGAKEWNWRFIRSRLSCPDEIRRSLRKTQIQAGAVLERYQDHLSPEEYRLVRNYSEVGQRSFWGRRCTIFRGGHFKNGLARNIGLLAFV